MSQTKAQLIEGLNINTSAPADSLVIDSSGRRLVGTSSDTLTSTFVVQGNSASSTGASIIRMRRGVATPANNDTLGVIKFEDNSGGNGGEIELRRDGGTWASGSSYPGRLVFSTTADGASSPTERLRITSDGNIGIGTTSPGSDLHIARTSSATTDFRIEDNTGYAEIASSSGNLYITADRGGVGSKNMIFRVNGTTERMRIHSDGGISTNGLTAAPSASSFGTYIGRLSAGRFETFYNTTSGGTVAQIGGTAGYAIVRGDGDLENTNNRYTGLSDIKFKQNIEDSGSQWNDIKNIRVRKYELIANPDRKHIGVVAQELEKVSPGLVLERIHNEETGETAKSVAYSVLYMKAVKALQEAMERIEQLESSNADLLARVTALEAQ